MYNLHNICTDNEERVVRPKTTNIFSVFPTCSEGIELASILFLNFSSYISRFSSHLAYDLITFAVAVLRGGFNALRTMRPYRGGKLLNPSPAVPQLILSKSTDDNRLHSPAEYFLVAIHVCTSGSIIWLVYT